MKQAIIKCPCCGCSITVREKAVKHVDFKPLWDAMDSVWKAMNTLFKDLGK